MDKFTYSLNRITRILLIENPVGFAIGVLLGLTIFSLIQIFQIYFINTKFKYLVTLPITYFIAPTLLLVNIPQFPKIFQGRKYPQGIESSILFIEESRKKGIFSEVQIRHMYLNLYSTLLENKNEEKSITTE